MTVSPTEYEPFKEMLKFFYFGEIEQAESKTVGFLVQMLAVTDRFLATLACDAIMKLLLDSTGRISKDDIVIFYNQNADVFDDIKLKTMFLGALSAELGNIDRMYLTNSCEERKKFFTSLSLRAIIEFFSQDVLFVSAENMVFKLILYWISANYQIKLQELFALRPVIRVGFLSFAVINEVVFITPFLDVDFHSVEFLLNYSHQISKFPDMQFNKTVYTTQTNVPKSWFEKRQYLVNETLPITLTNTQIPAIFQSGTKFSPSTRIAWKGLIFTSEVMFFDTGKICGQIVVKFPSCTGDKKLTGVVKVTVTFGTMQLGPFEHFTGRYDALYEWHAGKNIAMTAQELTDTFGMDANGITVRMLISDVNM